MAKEHHCNIVQLVADDLGLMLGCYGLQAIKTPNIDRLASQGTRFTQAFASIASCSGSRSTIYTGLHTHQNGQYGLNHGWNHTGIIGKFNVRPREVYPWEWFAPSHSRGVPELILEQLEARGLSDKTLVILVSDNGAAFVNSKITLYDAGVKLPLIVGQPGAKAGVTAQSDTPEVMIGRRRLAHYLFLGLEEPFDLEADPEEINNLAKDAAHQTILEAMRKKMEE
ncbi:alkaline-phosphatase-like protein [Trichoderma sp. SZMC 28014]